MPDNSRPVLRDTTPRASWTSMNSGSEPLERPLAVLPVKLVAMRVRRKHKEAVANSSLAVGAFRYAHTLRRRFALPSNGCFTPVCNMDSGRSPNSTKRKRQSTQSPKSQKRVVTGRSSHRRHKFSNIWATCDCTLHSQLVCDEPLERPMWCCREPGGP